MALTWRNVTEREQLRREAERTVALLWAIADNMPAKLYVKDTDERYVLVNRAYADLFGHDPSYFVGRRPADFMPAETAALVREHDLRVLRDGEVVEAPEQLGAGPRRAALHLGQVPAPRRARELYGMGGISTDITRLVRAEEELRALSADLERRVDDRTEDLRRRTLELEVANRELEAFSYSVSHDLRAPLRAIDGFSRLVVEEHADTLPEDARADLERVRAASQRMAALIDELLKLSRLSRRPMHVVDVDLSAMVAEIVEEIRAGDGGAAFEAVVAPGVVAQGDPTLLRTALANLIGNAVKFSARAEHPRIEFAEGRHDGERAFLVRDNGVGFDPRYADRPLPSLRAPALEPRLRRHRGRAGDRAARRPPSRRRGLGGRCAR